MKHLFIFIFPFSLIFQTNIYAQVNDDVLVLTKNSNNKKKKLNKVKK